MTQQPNPTSEYILMLPINIYGAPTFQNSWIRHCLNSNHSGCEWNVKLYMTTTIVYEISLYFSSTLLFY